MKNILYLIILSILTAACASTRQAAKSETVRIETKTETVYVPDTVIIERPQIVQQNVTTDTVSVLDNRYAHSEAAVSSGQLKHTLEAKPVKDSIKVQTKIVYRDSIQIVDRYLLEEVEVPAKLSRWQKFRMDAGLVFLCIIALTLIYLCTKYIYRFFIH